MLFHSLYKKYIFILKNQRIEFVFFFSFIRRTAFIFDIMTGTRWHKWHYFINVSHLGHGDKQHCGVDFSQAVHIVFLL